MIYSHTFCINWSYSCLLCLCANKASAIFEINNNNNNNNFQLLLGTTTTQKKSHLLLVTIQDLVLSVVKTLSFRLIHHWRIAVATTTTDHHQLWWKYWRWLRNRILRRHLFVFEENEILSNQNKAKRTAIVDNGCIKRV